MITFHKRWPSIVGAIVLTAALSIRLTSIAHGEGETGRVLPPDCRVNAAINTGREFPSSAIETIARHGGAVLVTPVGDDDNPALTVQLTVTGWTFYEDGPWGDLRDYEVECGLVSPMPSTVNLPLIVN
jgi:hypothetical protein